MSRLVCPKRAPLSWNVILSPDQPTDSFSARSRIHKCMARIVPVRPLLLYCYRRVTVAFESHEERSPGVPADTSEKTGLPKLRILNRKYGRREKTQQLAQNKNVDLSGRGVHWGLYETKKEG